MPWHGHAHLCPPPDCVPWLRTWETLMTAPQRHLANSGKLCSVCNAIQWGRNPQNCPLPWQGGGSGPHLIHGDCGPPNMPNGISIGQPFLGGTLSLHHRPTDHGNVSSNTSHLCYAMRCKNSCERATTSVTYYRLHAFATTIDDSPSTTRKNIRRGVP